MKDQVQMLIALQQIDTLILDKQRLADKIPLRTSEVDAPLKQAKADLDAAHGKSEQLAKKKREKEALLSDVQEKITKMKTRAGDIKTNKEYQAHLREIDSMQQDVSKIEDELLNIMEEMDTSVKGFEEKKKKAAAETEKINAFRKELDQEMESHLKELDRLKAERAGLAQRIGREVYTLYMSLLNAGHGLAVARARDEICLGCNMNMPPQLFVELKKGEEVITCPQCRRILYFSEEP